MERKEQQQIFSVFDTIKIENPLYIYNKVIKRKKDNICLR